MQEIYHKLLDISSRLSVLQCLDIEMMSFSDCKENSSYKFVLSGVSLCALDIRKNVDEIFSIIDL